MAIKVLFPWPLTLFHSPPTLQQYIHMLAGSSIQGTIGKYQNGIPKVARKAFNIGKVWSLVCCHGNNTVALVLWSRINTILLQRIKHFQYKLAEIAFFIIFDEY